MTKPSSCSKSNISISSSVAHEAEDDEIEAMCNQDQANSRGSAVFEVEDFLLHGPGPEYVNLGVALVV